MLKIAYVPRLLGEHSPEDEQNSIHGFYLRNQHLFEAEGIKLDLFADPANCDIAWIGNAVWDENLEKYANLPLIYDLVIDDSWLSTRVRKILADPGIFALTRGAVLRDLDKYNEDFFDDTYHGKLIREATPEAFDSDLQKVNKPLGESELSKMIPAPGFPHLLRLEKVFNWARENPELATGGGYRPRTCHFVGTVEFAKETISVHRKLACSVLSAAEKSDTIAGKLRNRENRMDRGEYLNTLRESKVCVSPWGYGERCNRDYEAIVNGCVLIKPESSHIRMYPDMFHPEANIYVPCKSDFSDLPEIIKEVEKNWADYQPMRERGYNMLMDAIKPQVAIKDVCTAIKEKYRLYLAARLNAA